MSKSEKRGKHDEDTTQLHRRSHPVSHPYKEGPPGRANGGTTKDALEDKDEDPRVSQHAKDKIKGLTGGDPTSKAINRAFPPPLNTHTHPISHYSLKALSCS